MAPIINISQHSEDETMFWQDQADLGSAQTMLDSIDLAPKHVIIAGISFTSVLAILLIAVIALFILYCKPACIGCYCKKEMRKSRVHRDSD